MASRNFNGEPQLSKPKPAKLSHGPRYPLALQLVSIIIVVALLTGSVVGLITTTTSRSAMQSMVLETNRSHAEMAAQLASDYIKAVEAHVQVFATRPDVLQAILNNTPQDLQPTLAEFVRIQKALSATGVYDTKGIQLIMSTAGATTIGQSFADRDYYQQVASTLQPYLGTPIISRATGQAIMTYAVPVFDANGRFVSILTGGISLAVLSKVVADIDYGEGTSVTLMDTRNGGSIIASAYMELLLTQPTGENLAIQRLLAGDNGSIIAADETGQTNFAGFASVPDLPMGVLVSTPKSTALSAVNTMTQQIILFVLIIVCCAALLGSLWMISITMPIRKLRIVSQKVAAGDFSQQAHIKQHNEIGDLGRAFDSMTRELADKDAGLRAYATDLEVRVSDRTAQLKVTQDNLQKLFDHQETILGAVPDIIMEVDNTKVYTWANQAGLDFFGNDVVGKQASQYFEGEQDTYQAVTPVFNGMPGTIYVESWQRRKDGEKRLLAWYCRSLRDSDGKVLGALSAAADITERKRSEEALKASEDKYRELFNNAAVGMYRTKIDGSAILEVNKALCDIVGYDREELLSNPSYIRWAAPGERPKLIELLLKHGYVENFEFDILTKSGIIKTCLNNIVMYPHRGYLEGSFIDITDRKQAETVLHDIIDNNPISIQIVDAEGCTLSGNPAFIRLFGQLPPPDFSIFTDLKSKSPELEKIISHARSGEVGNFPDMYYNPHDSSPEASDHPVWVRAILFPIGKSSGKPERFVFLHQDITARKLAEQEISLLNTELEQRVRDRTAALEAANKELEAFSYSVSHDLRAPLRGIDGWSQALMEEAGDKLNDAEKQYLDRVRGETQRLGELIEALLQLSRVSRVHLDIQAVDLSSLAEKISVVLRDKYPRQNTETLIQPGLVVSGDTRLLDSALANLLDNAWKFSGTREESRIEFGSLEQDNKKVYYVRDNGVGFDMRYADKLFGAFQRLHKVSEFPGHGIGLATVQRIMRIHGGKIWAEAGVDQGATFYFTL